MPVRVIDTIKPKSGTFPVAEAADIAVSASQRLPDALDLKANTADVTVSLAAKADTTAVNSALAAKVNTPVMTAALALKADTTTTDALQAQIDELVSPVTQDAEVQNARVGIDGTEYETLHARLDAENGAAADSIEAASSSLYTMLAGVGKNKCENAIVSGTTNHGVTATVNADKTVQLTGTADSNADAAFTLMSDTMFPAGTYHANGCPADGATAKYRIDYLVGGNSGTVYRDTGSGVDFTLATSQLVRATIAVYRGKAAPTDAFAPMICTAEAWQESQAYEPYASAVNLTNVINAGVAGKQDALTTPQLAATNSGITSGLVQKYDDTLSDFGQIFAFTGKNLLKNNVADGATSAGVTATVNADKSITLSGTASANAHAAFVIASGATFPAGTYFFSGCPSGGSVSTYRVDIVVGETVYRDTGNGATIEIEEGDEVLFQIGIYKGTAAPAAPFKPMFCTLLDWNESNEYEPYTKKATAHIVLEVGSNKRFTSLRAALEYATAHYQSDTIYEVRMYYSDYDVANDLTETELGTSSNYVGLKVTKNVRLVGMNNYRGCVIHLSLSADLAESVRKRISTINIEDNAELENLTISAVNCRYAVHDDFWTVANRKKTIKNCRFYGDGTYYHRAYGAGFRSGDEFLFQNCIFEQTDTTLAPVSAHNNTGFLKPATLTFENCRFIGGAYGAQFGSLNTNANGIINTIVFKGCKVPDGATAAVRLYEENASSYGAGCLMSVTGFGNSFGNDDVLIQTTDQQDYSDRVDLL